MCVFVDSAELRKIDCDTRPRWLYRVKINSKMRTWRNWQTRKIQVLVSTSSCRFKSCCPHQTRPSWTRNGSIGLFFYIFFGFKSCKQIKRDSNPAPKNAYYKTFWPIRQDRNSLIFALRGGYRRISQRIYQRHGKIALKHFILKNWVKPIVSLALFIYDTIFSQKYLVVDLLHCNKIYISMRFDLC